MNSKKKELLNALVIAEIPAPYRVDVFKEMSCEIKMDIFFNSCKDQSRSPEYFIKSDNLSFEILDNKESKKKFCFSLANISKYDMVIAYHPVCIPALLTELLCRIKKVPYYVNIDGAFINPNFWRDTIKKFVYRGARGCFSGGISGTDYYLHYGVKKENIFEYKFTCLHDDDIDRKIYDEMEKKNLRFQLGLEDKKTVISIGQFIPRKGFDVLLEAWKKIENDNIQLLIIGGGPERKKYEEFIKINCLKNIILIDFISKEKLKDYYHSANLFVLATREDVWGLVINEAMAVGLPVITTDMCNAGVQLIENGVNGYIVPVNDINTLANRIMQVLTSSNIDDMAQNNIDKIKEYTIKNVAENHMMAIKKTLKI